MLFNLSRASPATPTFKSRRNPADYLTRDSRLLASRIMNGFGVGRLVQVDIISSTACSVIPADRVCPSTPTCHKPRRNKRRSLRSSTLVSRIWVSAMASISDKRRWCFLTN